jgi:hypothetical protein
VNHELPTLYVNRTQGTDQENLAGLSDILLREPCKRTFNERTGTPFNSLEYPTDIVLLVVLWRLRYKLSLRDLAEMFLERGLVFTHEAVRDWEARFAPLLADRLRAKRRGQAGISWYVDETSVNVKGKWALHPVGGNWGKTEVKTCPSLNLVETHHQVSRRTSNAVSAYHRRGFSPRRAKAGRDRGAVRIRRPAYSQARDAE